MLFPFLVVSLLLCGPWGEALLQLRMSQRSTYVPVVLQSPKKPHQKYVISCQLACVTRLTPNLRPLPPKPAPRSKTTILVRSGEKRILDEIASWNENGIQDDNQLEQWTAQGLAFALGPAGSQALHDVESKRLTEKQDTLQRFGSAVKYSAQMYVQDPKAESFVLLSEKAVVLEEMRASLAAEEQQEGGGSSSRNKLVEQGKVFTNVSKLLLDEKMMERVDNIATRMHNEFPLDSPEWKRWTSKTTVYNATSLTQVMAAYYRDNSIGDVGGPNADYVPRRGFPGTLAPGEKFADNYEFEDLPHHVLHPWPSMQQIQFHVRYPPNHPMLPPPLLWFGLNNMYTDNFTNWQLSLPSEEIVGGAAMDPKDAIRIARFGNLGMSYDPVEQIPHGGMLFPGGHQIPFYNPDHGPTIPLETAAAPVPKHLLPITQRWLNPLYGLDIPVTKTPVEEHDVEDDLFEEEVRRAAAERLMEFMPKYLAPPPTEFQEGKLRVEDDITELLITRKTSLKEPEEWDEDRPERAATLSPEALAAAMAVPSKERDLARQITDSLFGK